MAPKKSIPRTLTKQPKPEEIAKVLVTPQPPDAVAPSGKTAATFHDSGHVTVTRDGQRAPELEKAWPILWAEHCETLGIDPTLYDLTTPSGKKIKIVKQLDGLTWKTHA